VSKVVVVDLEVEVALDVEPVVSYVVLNVVVVPYVVVREVSVDLDVVAEVETVTVLIKKFAPTSAFLFPSSSMS